MEMNSIRHSRRRILQGWQRVRISTPKTKKRPCDSTSPGTNSPKSPFSSLHSLDPSPKGTFLQGSRNIDMLICNGRKAGGYVGTLKRLVPSPIQPGM